MPFQRSSLSSLAQWVAVALGLQHAAAVSASGRPNIVVIMSDDQDVRLGSMKFMGAVQRELAAKGSTFANHHTTSAQCCPSRVALLRGQAAHNTNVTNVFAPGGNYEKFALSGEMNDYLPHWLNKAGYRTEYLGKFLNGVNILNWVSQPRGWNHVDVFLEPYQTTPNSVVMSENGNTPIWFKGFHQTDIIRAKALDRLDKLTATEQDQPFFLFLSPTAPHVDDETATTVPCQRHEGLFLNATVPRTPSFNPPDAVQRNKVSWLRDLEPMPDADVAWADAEYRRRAQALMGIDEMVADVVAKLEEKGVIDNTYIIYTSDNGYHLGQHRMAVGKTTPFAEDTNLPFVVRGPGVPAGARSTLVGSHLDLAPTFLDIAGVSPQEMPVFLDGRSLLPQWKDPQMKHPGAGEGGNAEVLNVEYWGTASIGTPNGRFASPKNTYKTVRIAGDGFGYLYSHWCETSDVELYNTTDDPHEITNLALNPTPETKRLMSRLNALLLATKSCAENTCRNPWQTVVANTAAAGSVASLKQALDPRLDDLFASFPQVTVARCLPVQLAANEAPFWPPLAQEGLGLAHRNYTPSLGPSYKFTPLVANDKPEGTAEQRHATLADMLGQARPLTKEELDPLQPRGMRNL
ncbi:hypothetical protein GGTG_01430 [Gaeumannomyces tritici R3-111a-1]|uniref:Sulfatase N-terminal domain-containing protein n=1 Tax=Gaeumannomyces tritici (strain R3-111a-1) TaxID=644352 RepID=J3NJJ9_GAET3|nr:hypothetical protein GGTG_01430 [Gaeumannomyces tritici R3-111a-1]EJT81451.1 hypothetical protein GGTG_01430 [Gaeumannomyces tritici R3-111a-1]